MNFSVVSAIFRRNFFAYFRNPTGYVFVVIYVLLCSLAAVWPEEFYNANLANLNLLNASMPYLLLVFIPAITMSLWAEERRQGTDELLLTIPATDSDVVAGKYLAALAVYSSALAYSMLCSFSLLSLLGTPDKGLFAANYFGYWLLGAAMLSIGMVASFLTTNLTVGFVLGSIFNGLLVFLSKAEMVTSLLSYFSDELDVAEKYARGMKQWSPEEQLRQFARGVIDLQNVLYFASIIMVMIYLSMVLIGRRHWQGGRDGAGLGWHYLSRAVAIAVTAFAIVKSSSALPSAFTRVDATVERLSSLSKQTRELLANLSPENPVKIDAYVSPDVDLPENFSETRLSLLAALDEIRARAEGNVVVEIHETKEYSESARLAEDQFGITPVERQWVSRGTMRSSQIFLGAAITSGLSRVVVPFFDKGVPIEYELVRSICTVSQQDRKTLGVLETQASLFGGMDMSTGQFTQEPQLTKELKKQYKVVRVSPANLKTTEFDVLLVVQPSTLSPEDLDSLIDVVESGKPTAIFEDPFPAFDGQLQRAAQMGGIAAGAQRLWDRLGVEYLPQNVIWSPYIPKPDLREQVPHEIVFVNDAKGKREAFNADSPITSNMQQMVFFFAGSFASRGDATDFMEEAKARVNFDSLVTTENDGGTTPTRILSQILTQPGSDMRMLNRSRRRSDSKFTIAARISGDLPDTEDLQMATPQEEASERDGTADELANEGAQENGADEEKKAEPEAAAGDASSIEPADAKENSAETNSKEAQDASKASPADSSENKPKVKPHANVVLVADVDLLSDRAFELRNYASDEPHFNFDNVPFVLNVLDVLAGDDRFVEIRKRRPKHASLEKLEANTAKFHEDSLNAAEEAQREFDTVLADLAKKTNEQREAVIAKNLDPIKEGMELARIRAIQERVGVVTRERLERELKRDLNNIKRLEHENVEKVRLNYKLGSIFVPPILPILLGMFVFFHRRAQEREGVARTRLRS